VVVASFDIAPLSKRVYNFNTTDIVHYKLQSNSTFTVVDEKNCVAVFKCSSVLNSCETNNSQAITIVNSNSYAITIELNEEYETCKHYQVKHIILSIMLFLFMTLLPYMMFLMVMVWTAVTLCIKNLNK
jgi:hypothetical protein